MSYLKAHNTTDGDPTPVITNKSKTEIEVENKTSLKIVNGVTTVEAYHTESTTNDDKTQKSTNGLNVSTIVDDVPVVIKSSSSNSSDGTKQGSIMVGTGTLDTNAGVITTTTTDQNGNKTTSVGVTGETGNEHASTSATTTIDVHTKDDPHK